MSDSCRLRFREPVKTSIVPLSHFCLAASEKIHIGGIGVLPEERHVIDRLHDGPFQDREEKALQPEAAAAGLGEKGKPFLVPEAGGREEGAIAAEGLHVLDVAARAEAGLLGDDAVVDEAPHDDGVDPLAQPAGENLVGAPLLPRPAQRGGGEVVVVDARGGNLRGAPRVARLIGVDEVVVLPEEAEDPEEGGDRACARWRARGPRPSRCPRRTPGGHRRA